MFTGGPLDVLSVLGLLCGVGLVGGYALLGAGWLVWKTTGATQAFAREIGHAALILTAAMMAVVSVWTALADPAVAARWFGWPNIAWLAPVPTATALVVAALWRSLWGRRAAVAFALAIVLFLLGFGGLVVSLWPYPGFPVWPAFCWREAAKFALLCSGLRHLRWRLHGTPSG